MATKNRRRSPQFTIESIEDLGNFMHRTSEYRSSPNEFDYQFKIKVDAEEIHNISCSALELIKLDVLKTLIRKKLDSSQECLNSDVDKSEKSNDLFFLRVFNYLSEYNYEVLSKKLLEWPSKLEKVHYSAKQILDNSESSISPYKNNSAAARLKVCDYEISNNIKNASWIAKWLDNHLLITNESWISKILLYGSALVWTSILFILLAYLHGISSDLYNAVKSGTNIYDAIIKLSAVISIIWTNTKAYNTFLGIYVISIGFGFAFRYKFILLPKWKYFVGWPSLIIFTTMAMILALKGSMFNSIAAILGFALPLILFGIYPGYEKLKDKLKSAEKSESEALTEVWNKFYDHQEISISAEINKRIYSSFIVSDIEKKITEIENLRTRAESRRFEFILGIKELISDLIVRGEISKTSTIIDDANKMTNSFNLDFQVLNTHKMSYSQLFEKIESIIYPTNVIVDGMLYDIRKAETELELMFNVWDKKLNDAASACIMNDLKL